MEIPYMQVLRAGYPAQVDKQRPNSQKPQATSPTAARDVTLQQNRYHNTNLTYPSDKPLSSHQSKYMLSEPDMRRDGATVCR